MSPAAGRSGSKANRSRTQRVRVPGVQGGGFRCARPDGTVGDGRGWSGIPARQAGYLPLPRPAGPIVKGLKPASFFPGRSLRCEPREFSAVAAWRLLGELRPDTVVGGGGFVAGPVGLAALLRRLPLVLTEADSHLGLTNRLLAPFARRVCLAFPIPGRDGPRYRVTGRPVPTPAVDRDSARERFGIGPTETCVLVFGGSQGARSINHAAIEAFAGAQFRVLHAAGERDPATLTAPGPHYDLRGYIPDFAEALAASDLVVARAGGGEVLRPPQRSAGSGGTLYVPSNPRS